MDLLWIKKKLENVESRKKFKLTMILCPIVTNILIFMIFTV